MKTIAQVSEAPVAIFQCWIDSHEENTINSKAEMYRPCDYKQFPLTRFRYKITFLKEGKCSWLQLEPNDRQHTMDGTWTYVKSAKTIEVFDSSKKSILKFKIVELQKDRLQLVRN